MVQQSFPDLSPSCGPRVGANAGRPLALCTMFHSLPNLVLVTYDY
jgi:hypothetical protein